MIPSRPNCDTIRILVVSSQSAKCRHPEVDSADETHDALQPTVLRHEKGLWRDNYNCYRCGKVPHPSHGTSASLRGDQGSPPTSELAQFGVSGASVMIVSSQFCTFRLASLSTCRKHTGAVQCRINTLCILSRRQGGIEFNRNTEPQHLSPELVLKNWKASIRAGLTQHAQNSVDRFEVLAPFQCLQLSWAMHISSTLAAEGATHGIGA